MRDFEKVLIKVSIYVFAFLVLFIPHFSFSNNLKGALKQLNQGKFEKTKKILDKELSKVQVNPGAKYVYSLYFTKTENPAYNLDSGYSYILSAIEDYKSVDEKNRKKLQKLNIADSTLLSQKNIIEAFVYENYVQMDSEEGYNNFIARFPTASQVTKAIKRRDEIAYEKAVETNTANSYLTFLKKYPDSELKEQATENYDFKLFQEATGTGTLPDYIDFLQKNPSSPYRARAEERVFKIYTVLNTKEKYEAYLKQFPQSQFQHTAYNYLLFKHLEENQLDEFINKYPGNKFLQKASDFNKRIDSTYFVFYDNKQFGFINELGGKLSQVRFDGVPDDYLCSGVKDEIILFKQGEDFGAIDKTGAPILPAEFEEIEKIGTGTLKVVEDGSASLYMMNGTRVLKENFEDLQKLNTAFVKVKSKGFWGIRGINGCEVLDPIYQDISFLEDDFFVIKKNNKYAITNSAELVKIAEAGKANLIFQYDTFDEINENYLEVGKGDKVGVLDSTLSIVLPINYSSISNSRKTWLAKRNEGTEIFNLKGSALSPVVFNKVVYGKGIFAVKHQSKWGIFNDSGLEILPLKYDSIVLIGDRVSLLYNENTLSGFFNYQNMVPITNQKKIEIQSTTPSPTDSTKTQYLVVEGKDGKIAVYNKNGKSLFKPLYDKITVVTQNLFVVEQKAKVGIVDSTGKVLLPLKYDGIGNYNQGYVSVLKGSQFGIFNASNKVTIPPKFDALIKVLDAKRKIFLAMDNGNYALMDEKGKPISESKFKEASIWQGDTILVKEGNSSYLYSIKNKSKVSPAFESVKYITEDEDEKLATVYSSSKYGILSNKRGFVVPIKYNDITNLGTTKKPFYMVEHHVQEADFYVVLYINHSGGIVMSQAYKSAEYDKLLCQD